MNAPVFSPKVLQSAGQVGDSFARWVQHYNGCAECQRADWYRPAVEQLCRKGAARFDGWVTATVTSHRII